MSSEESETNRGFNPEKQADASSESIAPPEVNEEPSSQTLSNVNEETPIQVTPEEERAKPVEESISTEAEIDLTKAEDIPVRSSEIGKVGVHRGPNLTDHGFSMPQKRVGTDGAENMNTSREATPAGLNIQGSNHVDLSRFIPQRQEPDIQKEDAQSRLLKKLRVEYDKEQASNTQQSLNSAQNPLQRAKNSINQRSNIGVKPYNVMNPQNVLMQQFPGRQGEKPGGLNLGGTNISQTMMNILGNANSFPMHGVNMNYGNAVKPAQVGRSGLPLNLTGMSPNFLAQQIQALNTFRNQGNKPFAEFLNSNNMGNNFLNIQESLEKNKQSNNMGYPLPNTFNNRQINHGNRNQMGMPRMSQEIVDHTAAAEKNLKVEDALKYLEFVKQCFATEPNTYNKFLDIMKKFKSSQIKTEGIIQEVLGLFKGQNKLILGFNDFLPAGYKIDVQGNLTIVTSPNDQAKTYYSAEGKQIYMDPSRTTVSSSDQDPNTKLEPTSSPGQDAGMREANGTQKQQSLGTGSDSMIQAVGGSSNTSGQMGYDAVKLQVAQQGAVGAVTPKDPQGKNQFTNAIEYVNQVKHRFSNDPQIYRTFLDMLHKYEKEEGSITEVVTGVANLFKDHSDLLSKFTIFLPEAERPNAKRIIKRIEKRRERRNAQKGLNNAGYKQGGLVATLDESDLDQEFDSDNLEESYTMYGIKKTKKGEKIMYQMPLLEKRFLEKLKVACHGTEGFGLFLRAMRLFAKQIIDKDELLNLVHQGLRDAQVPEPQRRSMLQDLDVLLSNRGIVRDEVEDAYTSLPLTEIDFTNASTCTPSYRKIPKRFPILNCSERTKLCNEVLNDQWVSVPTGSEDFSFKHMRKNIYEEALFKCEDEIYQFDMVIEANKSTILVFEKLNNELTVLKELKEKSEKKVIFSINKSILSIIHLKAIAKIYGKHGKKMLEYLRLHPEAAIPIILKRLKEKNLEWMLEKVRLDKEWKKIQEDNFSKSLDHRSFYFKQSDKKEISGKNLIAQMKTLSKEKTILAKSYRSSLTEFLTEAGVLKLHFRINKLQGRNYFSDIGGAEFIHVSCLKVLFVSLGHKILKSNHNPRGDSKFKVTKDEAQSFLADFVAPIFAVDVEQLDFSKWFKLVDHNQKRELGAKGDECEEPKFKTDGLSTPQKPRHRSHVEKETKSYQALSFISSSNLYLFFRLYNILFRRLAHVKEECEKAGKLSSLSSPTTPMPGKTLSPSSPLDKFTKIVGLIIEMMQGSITLEDFEDKCRKTVGPNAYFLFTLDKVLQQLERTINNVINDDKTVELEKSVKEVKDLVENEEVSLEDLVEMYRSCYQCVMHQVEGVCFQHTSTENDGNITLEISMVNSFPTLESTTAVSVYGMVPKKLSNGSVISCCIEETLFSTAQEETNLKLVTDIKLLNKKLIEEFETEEKDTGDEELKYMAGEKNLSNSSAKSSWWFFPKFENLVDKKWLSSGGELKRRLSHMPEVEEEMDVDESSDKKVDEESGSASESDEAEGHDDEDDHQSNSDDGEVDEEEEES
eukprot:snap_masked-scaffold_3-processed-gene-15.34-mRNA-1 protein AED:0.15 eAED:0.19 QI:0/0/0/0.5/1/1/2/0/1523